MVIKALSDPTEAHVRSEFSTQVDGRQTLLVAS